MSISPIKKKALEWSERKHLWDWVSITKFCISKQGKIPAPVEKKHDIKEVSLSSIYPTSPDDDTPKIPIDNIKVADHIPADENSKLSQLFFDVQVDLYTSPWSPMQPNAEEIDLDPEKALQNAYTQEHREYCPAPDLPIEYQGDDKPDLGILAVTGPYVGYLKKSTDNDRKGYYEWDLLELNKYPYREGLHSLGVRVWFKVEEDEHQNNRLQAVEIESTLGSTKPNDSDWPLAKKIALCAVSTHTSLVRHFNWVHLASGGPFAMATRNQLPLDHKLMPLLWPHIYGTQLSNRNVTYGQMAPGGKFETIFSFTYDGMCQLFRDTYEQYSISIIDPELNAQEKEIDDAPFEQPSLDNLKRLFDVIHAHTQRYVQAHYANDDEIKNDPHLLNWLKEMERLIPNGVSRMITTENIDRDKLARFTAGLIYLVTVQHESLGTSLWNYQLWVDKQPVRVYKDGSREKIDVYQRLVNANFDLNVKRTKLLDYLASLDIEQKEQDLFDQFKVELTQLQAEMDAKSFAHWRICPNVLEVNMNANVSQSSGMGREEKKQLLQRAHKLIEHCHWHELPLPLGLVSLRAIREKLREHNLHDSAHLLPKREQKYRTYDGKNTHWGCPHMGAAGTPFGRNFAPKYVYPDNSKLMHPNPREISRKLLERKEFLPVKQLNLLAAAWIQFQVHDWFAHEMQSKDNPDRLEIPGVDGDHWEHDPIKVRRTYSQTPDDGGPPIYINKNTHWWDSSQIYGNDEVTATKLRTGRDGKLKLNEKGLLLFDANGEDNKQNILTGFSDNWWIGLSMLHALFTAEHNAICDALKNQLPKYSDKGDEWLYQKARLINAALIAKIHTLEWTTGILSHDTIGMGMQANWTGVDTDDAEAVLGELIHKIDKKYNIPDTLLMKLPHLVSSGLLSGIVGSHSNHHGVPYSMTEEFVSVYRMHPLLPDEIELKSPFGNSEKSRKYSLLEVCLKETRGVMESFELSDLLYSFGTAHPGALRLHNFPNTLRKLETEDDGFIDLAAIDILRDRERGVPRYNKFRELLGMKRIETFEELVDESASAETIKTMYQGDIDQVDLMVGLFAEPLLEGMGFSETAFRIFLLMASRRLQSDRFFTSDFNGETYTSLGLEWIRNNTMLDVLKRHHPELKPALKGLDNAFKPWNPV